MKNSGTVIWFRRFAVTAAVLACLLAILGSWVRINGAGMTCPDWPLCKGSLVPTLEGGVVLEWAHRLIAALEGVVLLGALITGWRAQLLMAGIRPVLSALGIIFLLQVALGGLTVQLSNRPDSVVWHWATAMALIAALTVLAALSVMRPKTAPRVTPAAIVYATAGLAAFGAMAAGAYVSSSGAGLACPAFPGCDASHVWGIGGLQSAQMMHRAFAGIFTLAALAAGATATRTPGRGRYFALGGLGLLTLQIVLGVGNVVWELPTLLREAHAANAAATFVVFVLAAAVAAIEAAQPPASIISTVRGDTHSPSRLHGVAK